MRARPWLLLAVLVVGCSAPIAPTERPHASVADASAGATAPPSLEASDGWQRVDLRADRPINPLADVVVSDGMFYAAGSTGDPPVMPLVIRSNDGIIWTPEAISSAFAFPSSLHVVGGRLLALGAGETSNCAHPFALDTWARAADASWSEAPWVDALCAGLERADLLDRAGTAALVAVGSGDQPISWSSVDGLSWRDLHPHLADVFARAAIVDGHSILLFGSGPDGRPVALRSLDGSTFVDAAFPVLPPQASVLTAIQRGLELDVFLADGESLGLARRDAPGAWTVAPATGIRADQISEVTVVGQKLVALGTDDNGRAFGWFSADGLTWTQIALPIAEPDSSFGAIAAIGDTLVLVGATGTPDGSRTIGAIWMGSTELLKG